MQAGAVNIKLMADIADVQRKFAEVEQMAQNMSKRIELAAGIATKALGLLGIGMSVNWAKNMVMGSIESAAALNDLAIQAGVTVESLSGLAAVGKFSGQNAESIAAAMNRMTRSLSSVTEEGKGAGFALQTMGLDMREFQKLAPDEQFMLLARTLGEYQDGAGKAAVSMAIFGKEGAKLLPMMKDLALAGEIQAKTTTAQAEAADNFTDNLTRAKASSEAWQKQVSMGMVPALDLATQAFLDVMNSSGGVRDEIAKLSKDGTIARWTQAAIIGLSYVADGAQFLIRVFGVLITTLGTLALGAYEMAQGNFMRAGKAFSNGWSEVTTMFDDKMLGQRLRDRMKEIEATAKVAEAAKPVLDASKLDIKAQEAPAKAAQKLAEEAAKLADSGAKLYSSLTQVDSGLSGDFLEKWNSLNAAYKAGKLTVDQLTDAQRLLLEQQPFMKKAAEDRAKLEKQINDEMAKTLGEAWKQVDAIEAQAKSQEMANSTYGQGKSALAELTLAEMENQLAALEATENVIPGYVKALESRIDAQKRLIKAMKDGEVLDANEKAAKKAADEWERTANKINDSIVDALMRGFESGKDFAKNMRDTIVNMFKTMILRPVIQAIISPLGAGMASAFGASGAQAAGASGSSLGMIGTIKSVYDNIVGGFAMLGDKVAFAAQDIGAWLVNNTTGVLNQAGSSLMSSAGALGTAASYAGGALAGYGIGTAISGQYAAFGNKNIATVTGTAIGAVIAGPIGAAIGGAIGGLVNRAFGMGAKETQDYGLSGQFTASGASVSQYSRWHQEGGWFRSDKSGTDYAAINAELGKFLNGAVGMTTSATRAYASAIGLSADAVNGFSQSISISLKGLDDAAKEKAIAAAITGFGDAMAQTAYGATLSMFAKEGESASVTLARLGNSLMAVNQVLGTLNQSLLATSAMGADAASKLLDAFGGLDAFAQQTAAYYEAYYSEAERAAKATQLITQQLNSLGLSMPATREQFRAMVEAQDLSTESGRKLYAELLKLAPAFADVVPATTAAAAAVEEMATSIGRSADDIAREREGLMRELWQVMGDTASMRNAERMALDETNRALYDQIQAVKDQQAAAQDAARAAEAAAQAYQQAVASAQQALSQAQSNLSQAQSAVEAVRARGTQAYLQALERVNTLQAQVTDAQRQALLEFLDVAKQLRAYVSTQTDSPTQQFAQALSKAMAGDKDAMRSLTGLATGAVDAARLSAGSSAEYRRQQAIVLQQVQAAADEAQRRAGGAQPESAQDRLQADLLKAQQDLAEALSTANAMQAPLQAQSQSLIKEYQRALAALATATNEVSAAQAALNAISANTDATVVKINDLTDKTVDLRQSIARQFDLLDTTVNGLLNYDELTKGLKGIATDAQITKLIDSVDLNGDGQLSALELVNAAVDTVGEYSGGTMENTASALKAATKQIEALVFMNNDGLMAVSKNTAATLDYLKPMTDYLKNIDASTAKTAANPVVVNQSSGGGGLIGKVLSFFGFASGGVFGGQGIYNTPTPFMFNGGQLGVMGEAGPEAVMPLERMADGALGVRALPSFIYSQQSGADQTGYMAAMVDELGALRAEVSDLRAETRATAVNTGKSQRLWERVTQNGDAMQTVAAA